MLQIDAPGPRAFAEMAIDAWQLADPITAQIHNQPVMVQAHRDLVANQRRRHRVNHLPYLGRAGAPHPGTEQLVVGKTKGLQGPQLFELLLIPPLPGDIEGTEYLGEQLAVFGNVFKITAAAQKQLLLEPTFDMTVGTFHDPVLMGYSPVVTAGGKAVVAAKGLVAGGDIKGIAAVTVAVGSG